MARPLIALHVVKPSPAGLEVLKTSVSAYGKLYAGDGEPQIDLCTSVRL